MAAITTIIAVAALATAGAAAYSGYKSREDMADANKNAAAEQRKAQGEQRALKFQEQAQERRNQVREERVRRAKILQASENTGIGINAGDFGSSGVYGAVDGLSTQLNNNLGINAGRASAGDRIGGYMQNAADFNLAAQNASISAQNADSLFSLSSSIFSASGGVKALGFGPKK